MAAFMEVPPDTAALGLALRETLSVLDDGWTPDPGVASWLGRAAGHLPRSALRRRLRRLAAEMWVRLGRRRAARELLHVSWVQDAGIAPPVERWPLSRRAAEGSHPARCRGLALGGFYDRALRCFEAVGRSRTSVTGRRLLARLLSIRGECEALSRMLSTWGMVPWGPEFRRNCLRRRGLWAEVASRCDRLGDRSSGKDWVQCARDWMVAGDYERAERAAIRATGFYAGFLAAYLAYRRGDHGRALKRFAALLRRLSSWRHRGAANRWRRRIRYWTAASLMALGRGRRARRTWEGLARKIPADYYGLLARRWLHVTPRVRPLERHPPPPRPLLPRDLVRLLRACRGCRPCRRAAWLAHVGFLTEARWEVWLARKSRPAGPFPREAFGGRACRKARQALAELATVYLGLPSATEPSVGAMENLIGDQGRLAIPSPWVLGVARAESRLMPLAVSRVGAQGLLQLMPRTTRRLLELQGVDEPVGDRAFSPREAARLSSAYLRLLLESFSCLSLAAAAYNAGTSRLAEVLHGARKRGLRADELIEEFPIRGTSRYVRRVITFASAYALFHGGPLDGLVCLALPPKRQDPPL